VRPVLIGGSWAGKGDKHPSENMGTPNPRPLGTSRYRYLIGCEPEKTKNPTKYALFLLDGGIVAACSNLPGVGISGACDPCEIEEPD